VHETGQHLAKRLVAGHFEQRFLSGTKWLLVGLFVFLFLVRGHFRASSF
jgi:hypothetical protein